MPSGDNSTLEKLGIWDGSKIACGVGKSFDTPKNLRGTFEPTTVYKMVPFAKIEGESTGRIAGQPVFMVGIGEGVLVWVDVGVGRAVWVGRAVGVNVEVWDTSIVGETVGKIVEVRVAFTLELKPVVDGKLVGLCIPEQETTHKQTNHIEMDFNLCMIASSRKAAYGTHI